MEDINFIPESGKEKFFYGWIIVLAATLIYSIAAGQIVSFGVFVNPMTDELGWSRASITGAFGLYMIVMSIIAGVIGVLVDRIGPRILCIIGGIVMGLGCYLCSHANTKLQFYLYFSLLGGIGFSCLFVSLQSTVPRWFIEKKGLALGLFLAGQGFGGLILSPLLQFWISQYGWRTAFVYLAVSTVCIIIPVAFLLKKEPADMGLLPLGADSDASDKIKQDAPSLGGYTLSEALKTGKFWIFSFLVILFLIGVMMAQINMMPHFVDKGISAKVAASALGLAAFFNSIGRLVMGSVSDKIGTKRSLSICMALAALTLVWLVAVKETWMAFAFVIPFGFAFGGCVPQLPKIISEQFGIKEMGGIFGIFTTVTVLGPAIGPALGGAIFDKTGSYNLAFALGAVSISIGCAMFLLLKSPPKK
jgi:MFS family permease